LDCSVTKTVTEHAMSTSNSASISPFYLTFVRERPNGRLNCWRSALEDHKAFLAHLPARTLEGPDSLVTIAQAALELASSTRTIKRRILEAQTAAAAAKAAA
jgi:hypothetical protein